MLSGSRLLTIAATIGQNMEVPVMSPVFSRLSQVLESLGESSQFCTAGSLPPVLPGLEVEGVGKVGIPISAADTRRLIERASQAPRSTKRKKTRRSRHVKAGRRPRYRLSRCTRPRPLACGGRSDRSAQCQVKIALGMLDQASHEVSSPSTSNEAAQTAICAESSPWLCPWRARR